MATKGNRTSRNAIVTRGIDLCAQISYMSMQAERLSQPQRDLVVSFDVYCDLIEYSIYLQNMSTSSLSTLEEYLQADDLIFQTNSHQLVVVVDFFLPPNTILIRGAES
ncbi:MAG: hypothetical protein N3A63_05360 [Bacteroidetes bacterium]|nr:hypothetical protein [Bacteroidota bacterium]